MDQIFRVAIHHDNDCGYIEYNPVTKKVKVALENLTKRDAIAAFLNSPQVIPAAGSTLRDFKSLSFVPIENLTALKLALTHLWRHTGVLVDWSRPVSVR
ncbi:MAG TPA: hypothetical protein PKA10_20330 [Selenomonadales bacterium]|nr:hypothetical protein [Selenomonadales bacterium]